MKTKPTVVLFDANPIINGNRTGIGYYTHSLVLSLANKYPKELVLVGHYFNFLGRKNISSLPKAKNIKYKQSKLVPGKLISVTRKAGIHIPLEFLFKQKGDIVLFANYVSMPSMFKTKIYTVVHDLCYLELPDFVSKKNRDFLLKQVPLSIDRSWKIITISKASKQALTQHYGIDKQDILITPIPPVIGIHTRTSKRQSAIKTDKFILFVSTLEPRKNLMTLVKAYVSLPNKIKSTYSLVLAGGKGWYIDETLGFIDKQINNGENIVLTGYISDAERNNLYRTASLFVLPSHYEGFGMPILEAMSHNIPTIVSDIPVFHEVSEDASLYFDKDSPEDLALKIKTLVEDKALQKHLVRRGAEIVQSYSWIDIADKLYLDFMDASKKK